MRRRDVFAVVVVLVILGGVGGIVYVAWRQDPRNRFRKTRRQIRRLPEHRAKEKV